MHPKAEQVQKALADAGVETEVRELPDSTRTAAEAAAAIGTTEAQIVKSLVFLCNDAMILALVSGPNRVSLEKLGIVAGGQIEQPNAKAVKALTGFSVGGVPPVGHEDQPPTFIDEDLMAFDVVWAAGGTPHAVFPIRPSDLVAVTGGKVVDLKQ
ncbi:MAG TPA: YbaK/EbsC family protein [Actinopolymorphaceae bacterium]|jgi:prolyl-tRNA editing enzyme YbaK/EbsC (Cys-tRNA(Pro) deacylase)